jgi:crotonobetainyl-CoA:carnitine CoA-transferase CaiB-like acyl-CoA transferase
MKKILSGVTVVELSTGIAGPFCAKALADQGARVVKVEPRGGDPARRMAPFLDDDNPLESSAHFLYLNTDKQAITLDMETVTGRAVLDRLLAQADVCVESLSPAESQRLGITYERLSAANPRLVLASITPFGATGPYRDYADAEIVFQAMSGFMALSGAADREPVQAALNQAQLTAGRYAAVATLGALLHQRRTGQGQHVEVSILEAMAMMPPFHITSYSYAGVVEGRAPEAKNVMDGDYLECQDGYVCLTTGGGNSLEQWAIFFDLPQLLDPDFETEAQRQENWRKLDELFHSVLQDQRKHDFMRTAMDNRFVVGVVQTPGEILDCPQLAERGAFVSVEHPVAGVYRYPGPGYRMDGENPLEGAGAAPLLGQHTVEVLEGLGYTRDEIIRLRESGAI